MQVDDDNILPLSAAAFYILLALSVKPLYVYGLRQQSALDSGGVYQLGFGSIYKSLAGLQAIGAVERSGEEASTGSRFNRKMYQITRFGEQLLEMDLERYFLAVQLGRARLKHAKVKP